MASKSPNGKKESQGATTAKTKKQIVEVKVYSGNQEILEINKNSGNIGIHGVIKANAAQVEEDNFNFEAVSSTTVFPVFCQPLLVALNTVDENTKFVKFSLNKTIQVGSFPLKDEHK